MLADRALALMPICAWYMRACRVSTTKPFLWQATSAFAIWHVLVNYSITAVEKRKEHLCGCLSFLPHPKGMWVSRKDFYEL
jgi:hypothetical protein